MRIALPPVQQPSRQEMVLAAIEEGRRLFALGSPRAACRNQDEEAGWDEAKAEAAAVATLAPLQQMIDHAAELQELIDARLDDEWHRSGAW